MLLQFRKLSRGFIASVILGLVGLAMVAFLIPQSGISMPGSANLVQIGARTVTPAQLSRELELTLRGGRANGRNVSQQEAVDAGLHLRLLEGIIGRRAFDNYAQKIGVSASDAQVGERIRSIPAVMNPVTRQFDRAAYDAFLQQLQYNRAEFENDMRGDITREMLMQSLVAGVRAPSSFGAIGLAYQSETRVVSIAEAPLSAAGAIPPPTEAQLQTFWEESQDSLRVPEFRALTLVYARPQDFIARVNIPETRLQEEFEARRAALTQPERRTYVRISAQTEAQANDAAARLGRGERADAVAAALSLQATRGENHARAEVTDANVAAAVFEMRAGAAPRVVRGSLTPWAVVQVQAVTPAVEPSLAAMRDELRQAIAIDEAGSLLNTAINTFEDARASGTPIAEAARQSGLGVVSIPAVEAGGHDAQGNEIEALAGMEELVTTAFATDEGEATDFAPVGDADVIISVDSVTPSFVRPLDDVRPQLTEVWIGRERARRLRDMSQDVIEAVRGGQSFAAAARANRFNMLVSSQQIDRRMASQIPARGLAGQIFADQQGAVVADARADGQAMLVAIVEQINRVDPAEHPEEVEATRLQLQQTLGESFAAALQDEIIRRANPRRNEQLINQTFRQSGDEEAPAQ
ncbi:peptidylprolyl isomerase [Terricaulis silvestris]|uniref:Peptidyl-prolyl cis-trans isomerase D n=1 Tax=Terricaulis silvestris TaxID=2686094 RepID=A0A6I6MKI8_9CAUL|nr:peptidylprolyl isomerase [Terricaulis silvestris]QGZ95189.1 Peptidyl-prolyl cis-trans isomerase D [Terricaulis silvestris]